MRLLSKLEQELCWRILQRDGHYNYLANILDGYLPDAKIYVRKQKVQEEQEKQKVQKVQKFTYSIRCLLEIARTFLSEKGMLKSVD